MRDDREPNILLRMWRNKDTRSVILQILTMALLFAFLAYIINNAVLNLAILGKTFSFDFLSFPASYDINQRLIEYTSQSTHFRAMLVGILNTALVAFFGIITATIVVSCSVLSGYPTTGSPATSFIALSNSPAMSRSCSTSC